MRSETSHQRFEKVGWSPITWSADSGALPRWPEACVLGHESLLTLARKVHAAADDGNATRMTEMAQHFAHALAVHRGREAVAVAHLPPAEARILRRGQERLSATAQTLIDESTQGCPRQDGWCAARAEELVALLVLQARHERLALHDPTA